MIQLTLPYPPSANRYWRKFRNRIVLSPEARDYKHGVMARMKAMGFRNPTEKAIALTLRVYRPIRRGDLGNRFKVLEDALEGTIYEDDEQVVEIHMFRRDDKENPRVEVTVEPR